MSKRVNGIKEENAKIAGKNYKIIYNLMKRAADILEMDLEDPSLENGLSSKNLRGFAYKRKVSEFSISRLQSFLMKIENILQESYI